MKGDVGIKTEKKREDNLMIQQTQPTKQKLKPKTNTYQP